MMKRAFLFTSLFFLAALMMTGCTKEEQPQNPGQNEQGNQDEGTYFAFTAGPNKTIAFSKGNLQYNPAQQAFRFAEEQYYYIGYDNDKIDPSYNGWIDLFGWGTGDDPTNESIEESDYPSFHDWGEGMQGGWRTIEHAEWEYILESRANAASLMGKGSIDGNVGLILLPDNFQGSINSSLQSWNDNYLSVQQWKELERNGAIFLPAAGMRYGAQVMGPDEYAYYWTSTPASTEAAESLCFDYQLCDFYPVSRPIGQSVRLVKAM